MQKMFPGWLRVVWWLALLIVLGGFLVVVRGQSIAEGRATALDIVVFLGWFGLLLSPLFSEVKLFGLALKGEVTKLREEVGRELSAIRQEVKVGLDVRNTFSQTFVNHPSPAPEPKLRELEENLRRREVPPVGTNEWRPAEPSSDVIDMFKLRFSLEREVNRVVRERELDIRVGKGTSLPAQIRLLSQAELIPREISDAAREMFLITSRAIHGEMTSQGQLAFARDVAPRLLESLRAL